MSIVLLLVSAVQGLVVAPPPAPPRGYAVPMIHTVQNTPGPVQLITLDVEVRGGSELLWSGTMRVSERSSASFNRQQSNADPRECPLINIYYGDGERSSLSINMSANRRGTDTSSLDLRASWERPGDTDSCNERRSVRSVSVAESFWLEPGREQTIKADGGLSIRLHRR